MKLVYVVHFGTDKLVIKVSRSVYIKCTKQFGSFSSVPVSSVLINKFHCTYTAVQAVVETFNHTDQNFAFQLS